MIHWFSGMYISIQKFILSPDNVGPPNVRPPFGSSTAIMQFTQLAKDVKRKAQSRGIIVALCQEMGWVIFEFEYLIFIGYQYDIQLDSVRPTQQRYQAILMVYTFLNLNLSRLRVGIR